MCEIMLNIFVRKIQSLYLMSVENSIMENVFKKMFSLSKDSSGKR